MRDGKSIPQGLYTDDEIRSSYRRAINQKHQLKILADLNCCSVDDIKKILGVHEEPARKRKSSQKSRSAPDIG